MQLASQQLASEYLESFCAGPFQGFPRHVPALMSKSILSVSYDAMLLKTRSMLLKGEGYRVVSAMGFEQAVAQCKAGNFDLLILGHTVPDGDKRALIMIFRKHCPAPVLVLRRPGQAAIADTEYHSLSDSPQRLLDLVKQILSGPGKTP